MDLKAETREFLTTRRGRITPERANLPAYGGNRRVPGLRREEVAMLAGVSIDYYTRMERGNLAGVSEEILEALAEALQLDDAERSVAEENRHEQGEPEHSSEERAHDAEAASVGAGVYGHLRVCNDNIGEDICVEDSAQPDECREGEDDFSGGGHDRGGPPPSPLYRTIRRIVAANLGRHG